MHLKRKEILHIISWYVFMEKQENTTLFMNSSTLFEMHISIISYHIISYHITSYHVSGISYHIIFYFLSNQTIFKYHHTINDMHKSTNTILKTYQNYLSIVDSICCTKNHMLSTEDGTVARWVVFNHRFLSVRTVFIRI